VDHLGPDVERRLDAVGARPRSELPSVVEQHLVASHVDQQRRQTVEIGVER